MKIEKVFLLPLLLCANATFNTKPISLRDFDIYTLYTNTKNAIRPYHDKLINSQWIMPSIAAAIVLHCNYASYKDYQHLKLIPKDDCIEAATVLAQLTAKTIFIGRHSYLEYDAPSFDYGPDSVFVELQRGYYDLLTGNTTFVLSESQMTAAQLLGRLPFNTCIGFFGFLAFLCYAYNKYFNPDSLKPHTKNKALDSELIKETTQTDPA